MILTTKKAIFAFIFFSFAVMPALSQVMQLQHTYKKLNANNYIDGMHILAGELLLPANSSLMGTIVPSKSTESVKENLPGFSLGSTYYDLQSNASTQDRIVYTPDGGVDYLQMVWMGEKDQNGPAIGNQSRRTMYELFEISDPNTLTFLIGTENNSENLSSESNQRTGWPTIMAMKDGNSSVVTHRQNRSLNYNVSNGLAAAFQAKDINEGPMTSALWSRGDVCAKDYVHTIQTYTASFGGGAKDRNLTYTRSTNKGGDWVVFDAQSTAYAETLLSQATAGADCYAIDARDNVVMVMFINGITDLVYLKSYDNGLTFNESGLLFSGTNTRLHQKGTIEFTDNNIWVVSDTFITPGYHMDVQLDANGKGHFVFNPNVAYLRGRRTIDPLTGELVRVTGMGDTVFNFGPQATVDNISDPNFYQNEGFYYTMEGDTAANGDYSLYRCGPPAGNKWDGQNSVLSAVGSNNMSRFPNLAIDNDNTLYMVYTSVKNGDTKDVTLIRSGLTNPQEDTVVTALYGHLYMTHKKAGDFAWSAPVSLTPDGNDCLFSTLCDDVVQNTLYYGYSADATPGSYITNSGLENTIKIAAEETKVYISPFSINDLNESTAGMGRPVSVQEQPKGNKDLAKGNSMNIILSPNPVMNEATLNFQLGSIGVATIEVYSMTGEKVANIMNRFVTEGNHSVQFSTSQLPVGSYRISLKQNNTVSTVGMTIVR
jgi:hypothetical protein